MHYGKFVVIEDSEIILYLVLKKARKIGKGKHEKSFTIGSLIATLVLFSADFVQVVVKLNHAMFCSFNILFINSA